MNPYEMDDNQNICTKNSSWFLLKPSRMDREFCKYKLNEGDIIKLGKIKMKIKTIKFCNENENQKPKDISEKYNLKEIEIFKKEKLLTEDNQRIQTNGDLQENSNRFESFIRKNISCEWGTNKTNAFSPNRANLSTPKEKDNRICRSCYLKETNEKDPLIQPCKCSGSLQYIHFSCLKKWVNTNKFIKLEKTADWCLYVIKPLFCELCNSRFPDLIRHNGELYPIYPTIDFSSDFQQYLVLESLTLDKQHNKFIYLINLSAQQKISIGRSQKADIIFTEKSISRIHSLLLIDKTGVYLIDNDSKYGTLILIQTPIISLKDYLPLYIQIGVSFLEIKMRESFNLFCCCNSSIEEENLYNYFSQNSRHIMQKEVHTVKTEVFFEDEYFDNLNINNNIEEEKKNDIVEIGSNEDKIKICTISEKFSENANNTKTEKIVSPRLNNKNEESKMEESKTSENITESKSSSNISKKVSQNSLEEDDIEFNKLLV